MTTLPDEVTPESIIRELNRAKCAFQLRTIEIILKECGVCCGNGQTYGPNSGEDIICPNCKGTGSCQ